MRLQRTLEAVGAVAPGSAPPPRPSRRSGRSELTVCLLLGAALLFALLGMAGCGGSGKTGSSSSPGGGTGAAADAATTSVTGPSSGATNTSGTAIGSSGATTSADAKATIRVIYASSLIIPFAELQKKFEAEHPNIKVNSEAHGSIQVLRQVSDIHDEADVLISADSQLIPMLLYNSKDPQTGKPYGTWRIDFATNEMAIAYTAKSKFADEINSDNWYDVINRPGVRLGIADPRFDANGYRALMMLKLSEAYYKQPTLLFDTLDEQFTTPITEADEGQQSVIHVPEILETTSGAHLVLRGYSVQLLPLLETGDIDYSVEYLSVIKQHGLKYVKLPAAINLGDEALDDAYGKVRVDLDYQRFASVKPSFAGQAIRYSLTIPSNAAQPAAAQAFVAFLLGPEAKQILESYDHPVISQPRCDNLDALPPALKSLCVPMAP